MERLTYFKDGYWRVNFSGVQYQADFVDRLAAYEDIAELCGGFDRLRELAEADKDRRVLILPCAPDAIYWERSGSILAQARFEGLHVYEDGTIKYAGYGMEICAEDIGKTVFLTHEEAEKALREIQGKEDADGATDKPE